MFKDSFVYVETKSNKCNEKRTSKYATQYSGILSYQNKILTLYKGNTITGKPGFHCGVRPQG